MTPAERQARLRARIARAAELAARQRASAVARARTELAAAESRRARLAELIGGPAPGPETVPALGAAAGLRALLAPALDAADARVASARAELADALAAQLAAGARRDVAAEAARKSLRHAERARELAVAAQLPGRSAVPA